MRTQNYKADKVKALKEAYCESLAQAVAESPEKYPWHPARTPEDVCEKMFIAIGENGIHAVTIDSIGWKKTCRKIKINCTYKAIEGWLCT